MRRRMKSVKKMARAGQHVPLQALVKVKRQKYKMMCNIKDEGRMERRDGDERRDCIPTLLAIR